MVLSKFIKLVSHFVRFPVDIFLWPASVLFGWFHGIIKMHAMLTVTEVSTYPLWVDGKTNIIHRLHGDHELAPTRPIRREW